MATVTKKDIVNRLSDKLGVTQAQSTEALEAIIEIISKSLVEGHDVALRTFGTFEVRLTKGKLGRNPTRPEIEVAIPPRHVIRFKPGIEIKATVAALPVNLKDND
jgi:nucleoid DNA-binding protein